jgi:hypothetical protein
MCLEVLVVQLPRRSGSSVLLPAPFVGPLVCIDKISGGAWGAMWFVTTASAATVVAGEPR